MYLFGGAFCRGNSGYETALRDEFPDAISHFFRTQNHFKESLLIKVRRYAARGSFVEKTVNPRWCPDDGLFAIALKSDFIAKGGPDRDSDRPYLQFMKRLDDRLPAIAKTEPIIALYVECLGGTCIARVSTFVQGERTQQVDTTPDEYRTVMCTSFEQLGCDLWPSGNFPPLHRHAFDEERQN